MLKGKPYLLPFHPEHLSLIALKDTERRLCNTEMLTNMWECGGAAHTYMIDGRIICIYGFVQKFEGVLIVWVLPSVYAYDRPLAFVRQVKRGLDALVATVKPLHRIETVSYASPEVDRWMQVLGFTCEGTHKNWSKDKDTFRTWGIVIDG